MNRADGIDCYQKALRQGQRDYREKMNAGQSPFLPVLDDILQNVPVENQIPLGQVEIPLELLVGTKTSGRTAAFASNFMPLLGLKTEFATKWINLCVSHLDEGIRDPITCYEYMGRFYVQEGNKRVSVLKYFDASSITGNVTRVVPQYSDDPAVQMYYEFMHFYPVMQNYLLTFTKPGSYARLQKFWARHRTKSGLARIEPRSYRCTTGSRRRFWPTAAHGCSVPSATCCCFCCASTPRRSWPI